MSITLFGISNCDTVRKAKKWLEENNHDYHFHDFRKDGLDADHVKPWLAALGAKVVLNTRSTTWRGLDEATRDDAQADEDKLLVLLLEHPTLIKRPVLVTDSNDPICGFKADTYQQLFENT